MAIARFAFIVSRFGFYAAGLTERQIGVFGSVVIENRATVVIRSRRLIRHAAARQLRLVIA